MHADRHLVLESLRAGARAYVLKDNAFDHLRKAIAMVLRGGAYLSPDVTTLLVDAVVHPGVDSGQTPFEVLSAREREVLQLISEGKRTKEIADALFVSQKTVETHRKRIMDKLDLHSVAELTKYSVRHGITDIH
jgi:DNA-binding NarL/FixJ family response regulator